MKHRFPIFVGLVLTSMAWSNLTNADEWEAARAVFQNKCISCHGPDSQESNLRLDSRAGIAKGGDFGPILSDGDIEASELIRRLTTVNAKHRMPPDEEALPEEEIDLIKKWMAAGYPWDRELPEDHSSESEDASHWSWSALASPQIPSAGELDANDESVEPARNPIDFFIREALLEQGLRPSSAADRRTLIRRLYYDLHGLPPTQEEIESFEQDESIDVYEQLVDRLLNSPRYGERWARHWLDVVHYGDTHGYDKDKPRSNAWPYRDYVVQSFNHDVPYRMFIEEQIAGDVIEPSRGDGVIATGFLAAGPWDFIGHEEVPETKTDGKIARHLDRDDMVANSIGTFCSITIHCAQCHNHKFDPIPQEDYYSLQSVFAAIDRSDRPFSQDPSLMLEISDSEQQVYRQTAELDRITSKVRELAAEPLMNWKKLQQGSDRLGIVHGGYHSQMSTTRDAIKWVQIDLGESQTIDEVVLHPCYDDYNSIGEGFGFPVAYRIEASDDPDFGSNVQSIVSVDREGQSLADTAPIQTFTSVQGRYVRITATKLAWRGDEYFFAIAECQIINEAGENIARYKPVSALDSIEAPIRWQMSNLVDDDSSALRQASSVDTVKVAEQEIEARTGLELWQAYKSTLLESKRSQAAFDKFNGFPKVYSASTKKRQGIPRDIFVLSRGNVQAPRNEARPGSLGLLKELPSRFDPESARTDGARRIALANWISSEQNPLTWRSITNRVWQYHFGAGLVATSNDFGRMGSAPSHPELLDWLAMELQQNQGSLKSLHRLIVLSATYRQTSHATEEHLTLDSTNQYLARFSRQRLDAESVRDTVLFTAGSLDLRMGGPGWQDFKVERPEHSPHYRYDLVDLNDRSTWRRSIYRFVVRSQTQPFLTSLDCADPSMRVEKRNSSITPLQSLAMLNNSMMLVQSQELAMRIRECKLATPSDEIALAYRSVLGRDVTKDELEVLQSLQETAGLENVCRVLFNLNEFLFVD